MIETTLRYFNSPELTNKREYTVNFQLNQIELREESTFIPFLVE